MIKPIVRLAEDGEGERIRDILQANGLVPNGLDWSRVHPFWMVAEWRGEVVACVQMLIGKPLGHLNFWAVDPAYDNMGFGIWVWKAAERVLAMSGCDGYQFTTNNSGILKRVDSPEVNGVVFSEATLSWVFKRLPQNHEPSRTTDKGRGEPEQAVP